MWGLRSGCQQHSAWAWHQWQCASDAGCWLFGEGLRRATRLRRPLSTGCGAAGSCQSVWMQRYASVCACVCARASAVGNNCVLHQRTPMHCQARPQSRAPVLVSQRVRVGAVEALSHGPRQRPGGTAAALQGAGPRGARPCRKGAPAAELIAHARRLCCVALLALAGNTVSEVTSLQH